MFFRQFLHPERACLSYMVGCPSRGVAAVIDPQADVAPYLALAEAAGLRVTQVLETHVQADHLSGYRALAEASGAEVYFEGSAALRSAFEPLRDGQVLRVGNRRIEVLHTPGHTPDSVCYLVDGWFLLTGDTLFVGDVGRVDLVEGTHKAPVEARAAAEQTPVQARAQALYESLARLAGLEDIVEVFPGHYAGSSCGRYMDGKPVSTIGRERRLNPGLKRLGDREAFMDFLFSDMPPPPPAFQTIKARNLGLIPAG